MTSDWQTAEVTTHPLQNGRWVRCIAHIRDNTTGEVRRYATAEILHDGDERPSDYIWEEGNFACDCNRALFFGYDIGAVDDGGRLKYPCGEGLFAVNLENPATGEIYYREFTH